MEMIKGKKIALIGGAGFIGHNLALKLKSLGADVHVIDGLSVNHLLSFSSTTKENPFRELCLRILNQRMDLLQRYQIPVHVQDARDYYQLSKLINQVIEPSVVVHLAAVAHADRSNKDPYSTFDHSLRTLENALDACRSTNVKHFIYFSSSMVYGHFPEGHVSEETLCNPLGIYGALKFAGEKMVIAYNQAFNVPYTIVRPSALYGERCVSRRVGQIFIENALKNSDITISGNGEDRLDFTYIDDLVSGIVNVIESDKAKGEIFNLTYGESRSINQMVNILKQFFPEIKVSYTPKDKLTPDRGTLSVEKARRLIGYRPSNPLDVGF